MGASRGADVGLDGLRSEVLNALPLRGCLRSERLERLLRQTHRCQLGALLLGDVALRKFGHRRKAHARHKVAQRLALLPRVLPVHKDGLQRRLQLTQLHLVHVQLAQARLRRGAAHPQLIRVGPVAHKADLRHVRTSAAVGAASHPRHKGLIAQAQLVQEGDHAVDHGGHPALRLRHGQTAQRERGAGHRGEVHRVDGGIAHIHKTTSGESSQDVVFPFRLQIPENQVLLVGDDEIQVVLLHERAHRSLQVAHETAVLDIHAVRQHPIALLHPSHRLQVLPGRHRPERVKFLPKVLLHNGAEAVHAPLVHQVLQARLLAVVTAAVVALRRHDGLQRVEDVLLGHKTDGVREAGERVLVPVGASQTAARHNVVTNNIAIGIRNHDYADVIGEEVHRVVARYGDRHLELARQELSAVDGLRGVLKVGAKAVEGAVRGHFGVLTGAAHKLLPVKPHVVVGAALRRKKIRNVIGQLRGVLIQRVLQRRGWRDDVAVDVTARAERRAHVLDDCGKDRLEVLLQHAVKLERLARGQPHRPVAKLV
mmetsp:Transcript_17018/g.30409  ORF Transcript_17018/g.30409 Transcript_17018/m.30409 type:complete len:539 (+) Transcript_17018:171-1787(+)